MTNLSINLNKIALLRNSRGRNFPNVIDFADKFILLGAQGITVHPRQDERHITIQDTIDLGNHFAQNTDVELNIEGYPSEDFLALVERLKPAQCTLVPDRGLLRLSAESYAKPEFHCFCHLYSPVMRI